MGRSFIRTFRASSSIPVASALVDVPSTSTVAFSLLPHIESRVSIPVVYVSLPLQDLQSEHTKSGSGLASTENRPLLGEKGAEEGRREGRGGGREDGRGEG